MVAHVLVLAYLLSPASPATLPSHQPRGGWRHDKPLGVVPLVRAYYWGVKNRTAYAIKATMALKV